MPHPSDTTTPRGLMIASAIWAIWLAVFYGGYLLGRGSGGVFF